MTALFELKPLRPTMWHVLYVLRVFRNLLGGRQDLWFDQGNLLHKRRTGNAEFSEPYDENIFCLNSAFRNPNSELNGGSDVLRFAGPTD
jgi:hypothetical protein